jgi:hypothetical protein
MNNIEFGQWLKKYIKANYNSVANFVATYNLKSASLVYDIIAGRRLPSPQILNLCGWTRVKSVSYEMEKK